MKWIFIVWVGYDILMILFVDKIDMYLMLLKVDLKWKYFKFFIRYFMLKLNVILLVNFLDKYKIMICKVWLRC